MKELKDLGLGKYESQLYEALLVVGKGNAKLLSKKSQVPITAVYPALFSLTTKGLIQKSKGDTTMYVLLDPKKAINQYVDNRKKDLDAIEKRAIEEAQRKQKSDTEVDLKEVVSVSHGREYSKQIYYDSFKRTKKTFYLLGWRMTETRDKYALLHEYKKLLKKGVDVRIILTGPREKRWQLVKDYIEEGVSVRYAPLEKFSIFIRDKEECKITIKDKMKARTNIHVMDEHLSSAMHEYFMKVWETAEELRI